MAKNVPDSKAGRIHVFRFDVVRPAPMILPGISRIPITQSWLNSAEKRAIAQLNSKLVTPAIFPEKADFSDDYIVLKDFFDIFNHLAPLFDTPVACRGFY